MRGSSFLAEQITANKNMSYDEIVGVSRLMCLYACMDSSHAWLPLQCFMCDFKLTKYDHILSIITLLETNIAPENGWLEY